MEFMSGIQLNEMFYHEIVQPILAQNFPGLAHSAALIGNGSEVLGFDTARSMDHGWGPRLQLFLASPDLDRYREELRECLRQKLPRTFRGFSVNFSEPDLSDGGTQRMKPSESGPVNHLIEVRTIQGFFRRALGIDPHAEIAPIDWLTFPEQALLELTRGKIFHDGLNELETMRAKFAYYPRDVWLYRLASQWQRISQEEPFVGRCGDVGDDIGSRIIAARLVRDLMRLGFLIEKTYAPYSKWFGTAFARLDCAQQLTPILGCALAADEWQEREAALCEAYVILAEKSNALGITARVEPTITNFFTRPYRVIFAARFAQAIHKEIADETIKRIDEWMGGVDQFSDSVDLIDNPRFAHRTKILYTLEQPT